MPTWSSINWPFFFFWATRDHTTVKHWHIFLLWRLNVDASSCKWWFILHSALFTVPFLWFGFHQFLREASVFLTAKCSTALTSYCSCQLCLSAVLSLGRYSVLWVFRDFSHTKAVGLKTKIMTWKKLKSLESWVIINCGFITISNA